MSIVKLGYNTNMQANTVFDKLVKDLSRDERRRMLEKIGSLFSISEEPLAEEEPASPSVDLDQTYANLGLMAKLVIFLKTLFSGRTREDVLEERLLSDVAREIHRRYPGLLDTSRGLVLPAFVEEVKNLRENIAVFVPVLGKIMGPQKTDFVAFLAGLEMEEARNRLLEETEPSYQIAKYLSKGEVPVRGEENENLAPPPSSDLSDTEIKKMMENSLDDVLQFLPAAGRAVMYRNMKLIHYLYTLSAFPFDRLIGAFNPVSELPPVACPIGRIKDPVIRLAEIMHSMKIAPSPALIKAMFLFLDDEKAENSAYNMEEDLTRQGKAADTALEKIRSLNRNFPFVLLARYVSGDINHVCADIGGGEDWFALLKQFWRGRIDQLHRAFTAERKRTEVRTEIQEALGPVQFIPLRNYSFPSSEGEDPGTFSLTLGLLKTFFSRIFPAEFNRYLKILLIDGEFYKDDNRQEFTESYTILLKAGENLEAYENKFEAGGEMRKAVEAVEKDMAPGAMKKRKIENIVRNADREAEALIGGVQNGLQAVARILNGILYGEIGGRYDTLSNYGYLGGKSNQNFTKGLDDVLRKTKTMAALTEKAFLVESSRM